MLELAIRDQPAFTISRIDLERPGHSFTARSLEILRARLAPDVELHFLMGQDSLRDFPNWRFPDQIARQVRLGVAQRPGFDVSVEAVERAVPETAGRIELVPIPLIGVSSRDLRRRICAGEPYRYQVLPDVADYIERSGLYLDVPSAFIVHDATL
jgi:nicotinate-nucleotide adenylyltransferase